MPRRFTGMSTSVDRLAEMPPPESQFFLTNTMILPIAPSPTDHQEPGLLFLLLGGPRRRITVETTVPHFGKPQIKRAPSFEPEAETARLSGFVASATSSSVNNTNGR